jgi:prepilin-type N-terminal cleavage/methylation domain-containing protein
MDLNYQRKNHTLTFTPSHVSTFSPLRNPKFKIKNLRVSASRKRGEKSNRSLRLPATGFTLIELMAATTVLSVILLMMVGMQDQMSRAWSNSNRRTDATREARAACRLMASDLSCLIYRGQELDNQDSIAPILNNQGLPFYYSSNGLGSNNSPSPFSIAGVQPGASLLFAISRVKAQGTSPEDLAIVGYYIASKQTTNVSGFVTTNYNLYRHYVPASNAVGKLNSWFGTASRTATNLFVPDPTKDDILARNTCNLRITFYNRPDGTYSTGRPNKVQNGLNYQCPSAGNTTFYSGSKIQAEISVYPEDLAQKIPYTSWVNSTNIQKYARSYEFRVDVLRN